MFIIGSSKEIEDLKVANNEDASNAGKFDYTIACQTKVLTWISLSFFNHYFYLFLFFCIQAHASERESHKRFRFKTSLFMAFLFVPFMISWNIYGNVMIKQEYFAGAGGTQAG